MVKTASKRRVVDITERVEKQVPDDFSGLVAVNVLHTTCALTTADLDPGTDRDFLDFLKAITPAVKWRHPHDPQHAPDHLLTSLIGTAVTLTAAKGKLRLGTWQRLVLVELDGPRDRELTIQLVNSE